MSQLSTRIDKKLASLSSPSFDPYIFKVNDQLRKENKTAYEPEILAIGPHHSHNVNLQMMEKHKLWYLQGLLKRRNEWSNRYVVAMQKLKEITRSCYAESINLEEDKLVEMMLLDGCFIIEMLRKCKSGKFGDTQDGIFKISQIWNAILRDLLLFENQLPFAILFNLFNMAKDSNQQSAPNNIVDLALDTLTERVTYLKNLPRSTIPPDNTVDHLLGLLHYTWCSSFAEIVSSRRNIDESQGSKWSFIKCATELKEAGIKFEKATESSSLFDIRFENGIMRIPPLRIYDDTEWFFRNMIAYKQYKQGIEPTYVTDYVIFMDRLINSPKDVEILCDCRVIDNWLGDDTTVSNIFNKMTNHVNTSSARFCYRKVFNDVNEYCGHLWHTWMANLKHNYFNSPWSIISVIGAFVLFVLTMIQTIYSI
ncbi:unnamed protein product [Ilex paraguariensis]|uniref:Uncharacterized protein n=1 Tax=Ilex paraguariensis TaxID=185542 RepID=A0ABC8V0Z0_9AQUA